MIEKERWLLVATALFVYASKLVELGQGLGDQSRSYLLT